MANNRLCGVDKNGEGTYTAEVIIKLFEALKGSAVTSLRCAAQCVFAFVSALLDTILTTPAPVLAVWQPTCSAPTEELL